MKKQVLFLILIIFLSGIVYAQNTSLDTARSLRLQYGNLIRIDKIGTFPAEIAPGTKGSINVEIRNAGDTEIRDVVVQIIPPLWISFLDDVSKRKFPIILAGESKNMSFTVISSPTVVEGVYSASININYLNKIGDRKEDNDTFAIVVKSKPNLFVKIESSELYKGNGKGDVTITFVNNDVADIRFLTAELEESADYDIISTNRMYIGDLDSDDFESVDFELKLLNEKDYITLPLKITYKDSLNSDYSDSVNVELRVRDASEVGKSSSNTWIIVLFIVAILIIAYLIYKKIKKRKNYSKDGFNRTERK